VRWICALLPALVGCLQSGVVHCDDGSLCPVDNVCVTGVGCITADRECDGANGDPCHYEGVPAGACKDGVCVPAGCGNGVREPDEACDDGNTNAFDMCSLDCRSTNACGNGVIDLLQGEQCDDGNLVDHDSCTSDCRTETPRWRDVTPRTPPGRGEAVMTWDALRGRVVMFGGFRAGNRFGDTWEWNGDGWAESLAAPRPPARMGTAIAFDPIEGVAVLFGGATSFGDTWTWDGATWRNVTPASSPPARLDHAMAFDGGRGVIVMFGGLRQTGQTLGDTWVWDGNTWAERQVPGPDPRFGATMTYDAARDRVVLFGGDDANGIELDDTWEWDGATWTKIDITSRTPPARAAAGAAFDGVCRCVVLVGGIAGGNPLGDVWSYDGTSWTEQAQGPSPRISPGVAYDPARRRVVVFGGFDPSGIAAVYFDETWLWDGSQWTQAAAATSPPASASQTLAYDARRGTTMAIVQGRTWAWNGVGWRDVEAAPSPGPVAYDVAHDVTVAFDGIDPAAAWDGAAWSVSPAPAPVPYRSKHAFGCAPGGTLAFGGIDPLTVALGDGWAWDGATWTQTTGETPSIRYDAASTCDPARNVAVLFGGIDVTTNQPDGDTWEWDGTVWRDATPPSSPAPRAELRLAYDPVRARTVLVGGGFDDVWEWDGAQWTFVATTENPPTRLDGGFAYDASRAEAVLFGGADASGTALADTWIYRWDAPGGDEACRTGFDTDRDTLVGCLDGDCVAVCARCGDGTCDPLEDCRLCAVDCGACEPVCGDFLCDPGETCAGDQCSP
jgi:cysteine-rich repeat protein